VARQHLEESYRAYMLEMHRELWQSQLERACGLYVLIVMSSTGYTRVTDPEAIARVIARPEGRRRDYWFLDCAPPMRCSPRRSTTG